MTLRPKLLVAIRRFRPLTLFDGVGVYDFADERDPPVLISEHPNMASAQEGADLLNLQTVLEIVLRARTEVK